MPHSSRASSPLQTGDPYRRIRRFLLFTYLLTALGLIAELLLLEHTEGFWQKLPLLLMGLSLVALAAFVFLPRALTKRIFQGVMGLLLLAGAWGLWMHYKGNVEFELEMYPELGGIDLFWASLKGATPVLAPGAVIGLGLLGGVYALFPRNLGGPPRKGSAPQKK